MVKIESQIYLFSYVTVSPKKKQEVEAFFMKTMSHILFIILYNIFVSVSLYPGFSTTYVILIIRETVSRFEHNYKQCAVHEASFGLYKIYDVCH